MITSVGLGKCPCGISARALLGLCWLKGRQVRHRRPSPVGSSCLALASFLPPGWLPGTSCAGDGELWGGRLVLSPFSLGTVSGCAMLDPEEVDGECLERLCCSTAGISPPDPCAAGLREERDGCELHQRHQKPLTYPRA